MDASPDNPGFSDNVEEDPSRTLDEGGTDRDDGAGLGIGNHENGNNEEEGLGTAEQEREDDAMAIDDGSGHHYEAEQQHEGQGGLAQEREESEQRHVEEHEEAHLNNMGTPPSDNEGHVSTPPNAISSLNNGGSHGEGQNAAVASSSSATQPSDAPVPVSVSTSSSSANQTQQRTYTGRILRFVTLGLSDAELVAPDPPSTAPPASCTITFQETTVVTEIRLVPKGLRPMANLSPGQEDWIGKTTPGTFDLTVFYSSPAPKPEASATETPQQQARANRWESLNKKMLKYQEKNKVQSLYTWKFTGKGHPIATKALLFRGNFQSLSVCILGKSVAEFKQELASQQQASSPTTSIPRQGSMSPPSTSHEPLKPAPQQNQQQQQQQPAAASPPQHTPPSPMMSPPDQHQTEDNQGSPHIVPTRRMSESSMGSAALPGNASIAGTNAIGRKGSAMQMGREVKILGWTDLSSVVGKPAEVTLNAASAEQKRQLEELAGTLEALLAGQPGFEQEYRERVEWGGNVAGVLDKAGKILAGLGLVEGGEEVLGTFVRGAKVAMDVDSGCSTKELLARGIEFTTRLISLSGEPALLALDSGLFSSILNFLRDPLTSLPLRLHCLEKWVDLLDSPLVCRYFVSQEDEREGVEGLLALLIRERMPKGYLDMVESGFRKLGVFEALSRIRTLVGEEDVEGGEGEEAEEVLSEIVECVTVIARSVASIDDFARPSTTDSSSPSTTSPFPYAHFKATNFTGSISKLLSSRRFRALPTFGSLLLPILGRFMVATCLDMRGLEWLASEHAESGCLMLWAILLGDSAATFSGPLQGASTGLEEGFEMDEVRRCPGIYTASCLVKPLFGARYGSASAVPGTEKSRKRAEALTLADSTIRNHFLTALEPGQLGILSAYTVYAASVCRLLVSQVSATTGGDAGQVAKLLQELEEMTVFDVGREALVHVLAGSKAALEAIVQLAADATESPWTSRIAMELLAHFVQHPLSLPRLKDPALLDTIASAIKSDSATTALLEPYISVMDVLKMKGFTAVLDLVVKPAHPTATDLANPQVVVKMTAALSVLLQGLIEFPPQVLACRISSEEVANMETRRGLMERLLSMLSRASEILVKVAEPVTSVRGGTGAKGEKGAGAAPEKKEIKLEDLRAEQQRSRAASPTPSIEGKPEAGRANSGVVPADVGAEASSSAGGGAKVTVLITTEMIQLRRQILDLLFILLKLLRAVMLTAYDAASTTSMASSSRPSVRKHYLAAVAAEETASGNPGEGDAAARATQVVLPNVVDESKMAKTPLHGVVPTLLDVLAALDFVDVRGTDYGGGAFLTPSGDSYQSTGTVTDEFSTTKLGDFYVVAKSKQTIAALIAAMSGAVTFEVDQDGLAHPLDINNQSSLLITRKASLLGGYEDGYGRQLLVLPRFMEPASSVFGDILNKFAWKEPGNAWVAVQLFNEMLPAPLPVYADLDSQSLRDYLARLQDEEDVEQLDLAADIESISGSVPHFRTYLAKSLYNVMPQLLELVKVGAVSSTRQFHLATRTLVLRLIDLDVDDIGLARGILEIVLENLAKVFDDNKTIKRRASEVLSVAGPLSAAPNMDGNDTVMEQAPTLTESPIAAEAPMLIDSDVDPAGSFELQKAASEASRWLSLLCAIAYLPAGRALLLCSRDRNGETREKPALRALALTMDVIRSLGSSSIATDLALETLQWIFSTRIPGAGDDLDDSLAVFWDTPDESDIAAVVSFILNTMRQTKDERMRSQLLLLFATIADSSSGTRVLLSSPEMRRSMRDMLDLVLDLLVIRATGGPSKIGAHELDVAIGLLSTFKQLAESSTSRRAASHFLAESVPIAEHEERVLRLNIMATHAQELMDSNGLRAMQLAERGAYDDEAAGLLDPGLCASLGELTRQLIGAMSVSQPLSGEDLLKSTLARRGTGQDDGTAEGDIEAEAPELDRMDSGFLQGDEEPSRKRTFADMMWSRPAAVPLAERAELYMADLEDESAGLLFDTVAEEVDLEAMAKEVLPELSLRKKLRYSSEINLADITRSKFQRNASGGKDRNKQQRGGAGGGGNKQLPYRQYQRNEFRSSHSARKANTSRAPSVHVDDFVRGGSAPQQPSTTSPVPTKGTGGPGGKGNDRRQSGGGQQGNRRQSGGGPGAQGNSGAQQGNQSRGGQQGQQGQGAPMRQGNQNQDRYGGPGQQGQRGQQQSGMSNQGPRGGQGSFNQMGVRGGGDRDNRTPIRGPGGAGQGQYGGPSPQQGGWSQGGAYGGPQPPRGGDRYGAPPPPPPRGPSGYDPRQGAYHDPRYGQPAPPRQNPQGGYYRDPPPPPPNQQRGYRR